MSALSVVLLLVIDAALGVWLGSMLFFSFVAAPRLFTVLEDDAAGRAVNDIFPRYYTFGTALGVVAIVAALFLGADNGFLPDVPLVGTVAVGVAANVYARWSLVPKMERAGDDAFAQYHGQSVALNGVAMLSVTFGLALAHF